MQPHLHEICQAPCPDRPMADRSTWSIVTPGLGAFRGTAGILIPMNTCRHAKFRCATTAI